MRHPHTNRRSITYVKQLWFPLVNQKSPLQPASMSQTTRVDSPTNEMANADDFKALVGEVRSLRQEVTRLSGL